MCNLVCLCLRVRHSLRLSVWVDKPALRLRCFCEHGCHFSAGLAAADGLDAQGAFGAGLRVGGGEEGEGEGGEEERESVHGG